eukprot:5928355-Prymnesium_polylepis.2
MMLLRRPSRVWRRVMRVPCRCAPRAEEQEAKIFAGPHYAGHVVEVVYRTRRPRTIAGNRIRNPRSRLTSAGRLVSFAQVTATSYFRLRVRNTRDRPLFSVESSRVDRPLFC